MHRPGQCKDHSDPMLGTETSLLEKRRFNEPAVDARVPAFHTQSLSYGIHAVLSRAASQRPCKSNETDQMSRFNEGLKKMIQMRV